ncbi:emp24/gp25L/p24 family/GOLD-domain-containing protein [Mycotypha africana]|uniref:emp24/gp25L/p24 family/GOLD-domain-containing protein n=1 Tax=Mycotypha africana TaxID=64632 RepID=UPI002301D346|nr:emp24/gp25L/p24 family/GOLD-domain-containing protein [Mycotypha africana]KAI8970340.1 emp24/gp25L/p24 family/GOLD-domain-containing protein [Mycotypha africana]
MYHMRSSFIVLLIASSILSLVSAVKFELPAVTKEHASQGVKCLSQYVAKDTLVLATVNVGQGYNQRVELEIFDGTEARNVYTKKSNINGEIRNAFNTIDEGEVMVCFTNILDEGFQEGDSYKRTVELEFSVGAEATDFKKIASAEKLDPLELELRKLETVVKEIVDEMNYLKRREARMRDTNGKRKSIC